MLKIFAYTALLVAFAAPAASEEFNPAEYLAENCSRCHDAGVYIRANRRVDSLPRLEAQVRRCDANLGARLFDEDIMALVGHLNEKYYKF